jgi:hypothetical protein
MGRGKFSQRYNKVKRYIKVRYIRVSLYIYYYKPSVIPTVLHGLVG